MTDVRVPDAAERARALDPDTSFIVQAPAGSGKTALLIQRVLVLLARVEAPEEIVAITFTRKAAAEMRERVLRALAAAAGDALPTNDHERTTRELARAVLARDAELGWRLRDSPQRLRIQTIDAFCAGLGRQLPLLSGLGGPPQLTEEAEPLYREAAREALAMLEAGGDDGDAVRRAVAHRDADLDGLENLVVKLLAKRDQWLRHLHDDDSSEALRGRLEGTLHAEVTARLQRLAEGLDAATVAEAGALAAGAATSRIEHGHDPGRLAAWLEKGDVLTADAADLPRWQGLAELLLTQKGEWRRSFTVREGFPPEGKATGEEAERRKRAKERIQTLCNDLRDAPALAERLDEARKLPMAGYPDAQWAVLGAVARLLLLAVLHLKLVFARQGRVDFSEVGQRAVAALVDTDGYPTDLALALDYRIRHLLVDEFQDTSYLQRELLKHLTEGWTPGEGRTLFLVGDPMQSIYRFREAEVALFLEAVRGVLGGVPLESLCLKANFRSRAGLVAWFNDTFPGVLAPVDNPDTGAVAYVAADAMRDAGDAPAVEVHPQLERDDDSEAQCIVQLIEQARASHPDGRIAVLVRGRPHLVALLPRLRAAGLRFRAVDIEKLADVPAVEQLWALARALLHRGDRVAWLALLRGTSCGLELADLLALVGDDQDPIPALLDDPGRLARLTVDGRARAERAWAVLRDALAGVGRHDLRPLVEGAWLELGGPAGAGGEAGLQAAEAFLELLERHASGGTLPEPDAFAEALERLYAPPDPEADEHLQLMTVHKAKGLEFDTVIVPGLGRATGGDPNPMLAWMELPGNGLLMAPIDARGGVRDPLYAWIRQLEKERVDHETGRLLYVAATRARERLHLLGHADLKEKDGEFTLRAPSGTFLERLWPSVSARYEARLDAADASPDEPGEDDNGVTVPQRRLPLDWTPPALPEAVVSPPLSAAPDPAEPVLFDWAGEGARAAGTVLHRLLEAWGRDGLPEGGVPPGPVAAYALTALREQGLSGAPLDTAAERVGRAAAATLADPRGRWLFDPGHLEARGELALTAELDGELVSLVIDRTFVDVDGVRWIVDFKTSDHGGGGLETFLDREQERYRAQLERYGRVLALLDDRPQRLALYFPLVGGWREWAPSA